MLRRDLNKMKVSIKIINVVFGESPQSQTVAISLWNRSLEPTLSKIIRGSYL
jgi:hypothetical protein